VVIHVCRENRQCRGVFLFYSCVYSCPLFARQAHPCNTLRHPCPWLCWTVFDPVLACCALSDALGLLKLRRASNHIFTRWSPLLLLSSLAPPPLLASRFILLSPSRWPSFLFASLLLRPLILSRHLFSVDTCLPVGYAACPRALALILDLLTLRCLSPKSQAGSPERPVFAI
jgi:hypothetical protein